MQAHTSGVIFKPVDPGLELCLVMWEFSDVTSTPSASPMPGILNTYHIEIGNFDGYGHTLPAFIESAGNCFPTLCM